MLAAVEASSVELLVVALRKSLGMTEMKGDCPGSSMHERLY